MKTKRIGAALLPACACLLSGMPAGAQDKPADVYVYSTYHFCDFAKQDRVDEIHAQLQQPAAEAAVKDGSISGHGWMAHQTGGKWRRADYFTAGSVQALLDAQEKMSAGDDAKAQKLNAEFGSICSSHEDYIWRRVAGNAGTAARGNAAFSTYYVCDQGRETQADALVQSSIAPILDKMVADGKLKTWGWNEHIVGGDFRRLETISAADVKTLMEARAALVEALQDKPAGDMLSDICPSHADYIWEIKSQAP